jgi:hypothetical protein
MKKEILGIFMCLFFASLLIISVYASPTKGNKVAVTLTFSNRSPDVIDEWVSGGVTHSLIINTWDVTLEIDDGPTYSGTAIDERKIVAVTQKNEVDQICRSYYEHSFPGGGFEGNSLLIIDGFTGSPPPLWDKTKIHYLLKGTRAFEGQTLNVGKTWTPFGGPLGASGFLLVKP